MILIQYDLRSSLSTTFNLVSRSPLLSSRFTRTCILILIIKMIVIKILGKNRRMMIVVTQRNICFIKQDMITDDYDDDDNDLFDQPGTLWLRIQDQLFSRSSSSWRQSSISFIIIISLCILILLEASESEGLYFVNSLWRLLNLMGSQRRWGENQEICMESSFRSLWWWWWWWRWW